MGRERVLQPGQVSFDLHLSGAWARATALRLPRARLAGPSIAPEFWNEASEAMSAMLAVHLALKHASRAMQGAPWLETPLPIPADELASLLSRTELFRDAIMHFEDKVDRARPPVNAIPKPGAPSGYVALSFGFHENGADLYATVKRAGPQRMTRVSWAEIEVAVRAIESWVLDVLGRWDEVKARWAT